MVMINIIIEIISNTLITTIDIMKNLFEYSPEGPVVPLRKLINCTTVIISKTINTTEKTPNKNGRIIFDFFIFPP